MKHDIIRRFISRTKTATKAKTHEVRLPISEANELALALSELLLRELERNSGQKPAPVMEIKIDGGSLK